MLFKLALNRSWADIETVHIGYLCKPKRRI